MCKGIKGALMWIISIGATYMTVAALLRALIDPLFKSYWICAIGITVFMLIAILTCPLTWKMCGMDCCVPAKAAHKKAKKKK